MNTPVVAILSEDKINPTRSREFLDELRHSFYGGPVLAFSSLAGLTAFATVKRNFALSLISFIGGQYGCGS